MPWPVRGIDRERLNRRPQKLVFLSLMTALAMVLQILESLIPNPVPWIRLGLANVIILIVLSVFGIKEGLIVTGLRVFLASTLLGTIFGPTFWLSFSGGMTSTLGMGLMLSLFPGTFSLIGVSIVGAFIHNLVQLAVAILFIIRQSGLVYLLPILLVTALIAGSITGVIATLVLKKIEVH